MEALSDRKDSEGFRRDRFVPSEKCGISMTNLGSRAYGALPMKRLLVVFAVALALNEAHARRTEKDRTLTWNIQIDTVCVAGYEQLPCPPLDPSFHSDPVKIKGPGMTEEPFSPDKIDCTTTHDCGEGN